MYFKVIPLPNRFMKLHQFGRVSEYIDQLIDMLTLV